MANLNNNKGINIKFPITSTFLETNKTTAAAIKENLKTLVLTTRGERLVNPEIGTRLSSLGGMLFEPMNKEQMQIVVEGDIVSAIEKFYPEVQVLSVEIKTPDEDTSLKPNEALIKIFYSFKEIEDDLSINVRK